MQPYPRLIPYTFSHLLHLLGQHRLEQQRPKFGRAQPSPLFNRSPSAHGHTLTPPLLHGDAYVDFDFSKFKLLREHHLSDVFRCGWGAIARCNLLEVLTLSNSVLGSSVEWLTDCTITSPLTIGALTDLHIHRSYEAIASSETSAASPCLHFALSLLRERPHALAAHCAHYTSWSQPVVGGTGSST